MEQEERIRQLEALGNHEDLTAGQKLTFVRLLTAVSLQNNREINRVFRELRRQNLQNPAILARLRLLDIPPQGKR